MHVERHGGPPDLQAAFTHFVLKVLRGRSLDEQKDAEAKLGKFPDFACLRGLMLLEMKHLEAEQTERLNEVYRAKVAPDEAPFFYGSRSIDADINKLSNSNEIKAALSNKLSQTIETILRKANAQFRDYRGRNPRKNSFSVCVLLNSQIAEFSPHVVLHSIHRKMKTGVDRFSDIDAVIYISEKHVQRLSDGHLGFGLGIFEAVGSTEQYWKVGLINLIVQRWSHYRTGTPAVSKTLQDGEFDPIFDVPEQMKRYKVWKLAYKRNPYLRPLTNNDLRVHFQRCVGFNSLSFVKGDWAKPPAEVTHAYGRMFSDTIDEINERGLDMRDFDSRLMTESDLVRAYSGLPRELVEILNPTSLKGAD